MDRNRPEGRILPSHPFLVPVKFGFYSCMSGVSWGGSEELWWRTARRLQGEGHAVCVNFKWWPESAWHLQQIAANGGELYFRDQPVPTGFWTRQRDRLGRLVGRKKNRSSSWTETCRPDLVLVTLGYHPDRIQIADECIANGIPYAINVQSASSFFFIHGDCVDQYRRWYQQAARVYFVSAENQHKVETNLAMRLENAEIVDNPFSVDRNLQIPWPESRDVFRLACVGRIHFQSKGQDMIVDVLRRPEWRQRNIEVLFFGHDQGNARQLADLIAQHGLQDRMKIAGFEKEVHRIWEQCHGLLLPSRYEGAALVVIEAMLSNRMAITTDTGRNRELIDEGVSGFVANGPTVELLAEAMERAWQARERWRAMGKLAGQHIRSRYSDDPVRDFAERLKTLASPGNGS